MPLPNDDSRCEGELEEPAPDRESKMRTICHRRETCQRYLDIGTGGERTPYHPLLCSGRPGYLFYIPVIEERKDA